MDEGLSIETGTVLKSDIALTATSDADGNIATDVKHLSIDPENVAQFRKQLQTSSKEEGKSATGFSTNADDKSASSSKPNISNPHQSFHAKTAVTFDTKTPIAPSKTFKNTNDAANVSEPMMFRETLKSAGTTSQDTLLDHTPPEKQTNDVHGTEKTSPKSFSTHPKPSLTLKSPTTLLRELSVPSVSTDVSKTTSKIPFVGTGESNVAHPSGNGSNTHQTEISNFDATCSAQKPPSKAKNGTPTAVPAAEKAKQERSPENTSEPQRTAVIDTIPFLRTANEIIAPVQAPTAAQTSKSHAILIAQQIRDHIIDRILVSSSALNDNRTVKVQLSPRLLRDTEVQFTQNGTSLDIRLVSQNKDSVQFLQQHQSDLQTYLQGELKTYRAISVRIPSSQTSAELSQPHDGRSRNRFDYQSADEEGTT